MSYEKRHILEQARTVGWKRVACLLSLLIAVAVSVDGRVASEELNQSQPSRNPNAGSAESSSNSIKQAMHIDSAPKGRVTANGWRGSIARPLQQIQQVSYEHPLPSDEGHIPDESLLVPYQQRTATYSDRPEPMANGIPAAAVPQDYIPWWHAIVSRPMRPSDSILPVNAESLVIAAIEYSPQVTALRIDPRIQETVIVQESAAFDWTAFLESRYDDTSDPVGNTLTTGGSPRFRDNHWTGQSGLRKRLQQGGEFDISQQIGYQDNNSRFFVPTQQGAARLAINFSQPILRGAGSLVNESRIVLAVMDYGISEQQLVDQLQAHLEAVYQAYWTLYQSRSVKLQKQRLLQRAEHILQWVSARQGLDTKRSQVLRTQAAVASRRSEIVRADTAIRNAESMLRLLVNSPALKMNQQTELLPSEMPLSSSLDVSLRGSVETALQNRPDIATAIQQIKATSLRLGVAKNDLLPRLDLVLSTYVAGLKGSGEIGQAMRNQYTEGEPGYSIGLIFEYPLGNRAARAQHDRREWEMAKAVKSFEAAVETGMTEVEIAVRELGTSHQETLSRYQSMIAAEAVAAGLDQQLREASGDPDVVVGVLLQDLLEAQERVADEEADFVQSQVNYVLSIIRLKRAAGVLLNCDYDPAR